MKKIFFVAILLTFFVHKIYAAAHQTIPIYHEEKVNHELSSEDKFGYAMPETILDAVIKNDKKVLEEIIESEKQNSNFENVINDTTIQTDLNGPSDFTPLMIAAANGNSIIAKILFEAGANPFLVNSNNQTFYDIAKDKPEFKEILEKYPDTQFKRLLAGIKFKTFQFSDPKASRLFQGKYAKKLSDLDKYSTSNIEYVYTIKDELLQAILNDQKYKVKEIMEKIPKKEFHEIYFDMQGNKITPLMLAVIEKKPDIVRLILEQNKVPLDQQKKLWLELLTKKDDLGNSALDYSVKVEKEENEECVVKKELKPKVAKVISDLFNQVDEQINYFNKTVTDTATKIPEITSIIRNYAQPYLNQNEE